jgi:hypothetical protein
LAVQKPTVLGVGMLTNRQSPISSPLFERIVFLSDLYGFFLLYKVAVFQWQITTIPVN